LNATPLQPREPRRPDPGATRPQACAQGGAWPARYVSGRSALPNRPCSILDPSVATSADYRRSCAQRARARPEHPSGVRIPHVRGYTARVSARMPRLSSSTSFRSLVATLWRLVRIPLWLGIGAACGFLVPYVIHLDGAVRDRFDDLSWQSPSRVYARPLLLAPGVPMSAEALGLELDAARYRKVADARAPGTFESNGNRYEISRRAFIYLDGRERARRIGFTL